MTERTRSLLTVTIALLAIMAYGSGGKPAAAQQKNPLVPDLVRNVDEPASIPFRSGFFAGNTGSVDLAVPTGKVAVIEFVSAAGTLEPGGVINAFVSCSDGSNQVAHNLVLTQQGSGSGSNRWIVSQPVKCYATTRNSTSGGARRGFGNYDS